MTIEGSQSVHSIVHGCLYLEKSEERYKNIAKNFEEKHKIRITNIEEK